MSGDFPLCESSPIYIYTALHHLFIDRRVRWDGRGIDLGDNKEVFVIPCNDLSSFDSTLNKPCHSESMFGHQSKLVTPDHVSQKGGFTFLGLSLRRSKARGRLEGSAPHTPSSWLR